jgi:hypothetical protein
VAYDIEIDEALVLDYLRNPEHGLAEADVDGLLDFLEGLAHTGEAYRMDPTRRCSPNSANFKVTYIFADSAGKWRSIRFIVSDAAAAYGVLRVRYADGL